MYASEEYASLFEILSTTEASLLYKVDLEDPLYQEKSVSFYTTPLSSEENSIMEDYLCLEEFEERGHLFYSENSLYDSLEELPHDHSYKGYWPTLNSRDPFPLSISSFDKPKCLEEKDNSLSVHSVEELSYITPNEPDYIRVNELEDSTVQPLYEFQEIPYSNEQREYVYLQDFPVQSFLSYKTLLDYNNFLYYYFERLTEYSISHQPEECYLFMEEYLGGKKETTRNQEYSFFSEISC